MSVTSVPEKVKTRLWGKAAGRCQYEGCNKPLWIDSLTKAEFNQSYIAHIVADKPDGPRGDPVRSEELKADIGNLMLLCDAHHRLIDKADVNGHPEARLLAMKRSHESRIEILTAIVENKASHVFLYGANIGRQSVPLSYDMASLAMVPHRYPATTQPITASILNSLSNDTQATYWPQESAQLRATIEQHLRPRIRSGEIQHISVFALAPQPLLMLLGTELSEIQNCEVYQLRKDPHSWKFEDEPETCDFIIQEPKNAAGTQLALVLSLSGTVDDNRIHRVLGNDVSIWRLTIDCPNNDFVRSRGQIADFKRAVRPLLDQMKASHGQDAVLHVFPAMPVALAVEFGRCVNRKADLPMVIYDEHIGEDGFSVAVKIGNTEVGEF